MHMHRRSAIGVGRSLTLGLTAAAVLLMVTASTASGAPHHNHGLTIAATPDRITAGEGVLIYGQLTGPDNAHRRVRLFHRINPAHRFTPVGVRRTNGSGFYEFIRADGVVKTNRNWFVLGPGDTHSRTIHELASSIVTLNAGTTAATTADTVDLSGSVTPAHAHQRVLLQEQTSSTGSDWKTIDVGYTGGHSNYSIAHRFRTPGTYTLRALFPDDPRNVAGQSASIGLTVQQQQNPSFTINASAQPITNGQSETITGTLQASGSTTAVAPNVSVTLYGRQGTGAFRALQTTQTDSSGGYTFTTMPSYNTVYHVAAAHGEKTANLYVGVQDVVSATLSASTIALGDAAQVTGTVTPDHGGHVLYLQQQSSAGQWIDVQTAHLGTRSQFSFSYRPGMAGTLNLRVQITGGPWSIGGISTALPLTVSGAAPISSLPPAS